MNNIKKDFPLLENENITYLDSGATTQKPIQVIKAIEEYYEKNNANPHRGAYTLSMEATEEYENTREHPIIHRLAGVQSSRYHKKVYRIPHSPAGTGGLPAGCNRYRSCRSRL